MEKEQKRYYLVEYCGTKEKILGSREEVDKVLEDIRLYNNRKTSKYLCGNITVEYIAGKFKLVSHIYHKLTPRSKISELDEKTSQLSERELIVQYAE